MLESFKNSPRLQRMRNALASRFMQRLKRATHRTSVRLRDVVPGRVLVIAPHRDDEVIPVGGTLLRHQALGSALGVVFVTDSGGPHRGSADELIRLRKQESAKVLGRLHMEVVGDLDVPDGEAVRHETRIASGIQECVRTFRPDVVITPSPADNHADHQATSIGAAAALTDLRFAGEVWAYELWTTIWPNVLVDISGVVDEKRELIQLYASQQADRDYASAILGLNRYRGLRVQVDSAEAYFVGTAADYSRSTALLNRI